MTTEQQLEAQLEKLGAKLPRPRSCFHCDFSGGTRGVDRCPKCKGTGSIFLIGDRLFPNTEEGYLRALQAAVHHHTPLAKDQTP